MRAAAKPIGKPNQVKKGSPIIQAVMSAGPGIVVTVISIILFSNLDGLSLNEQNVFSITILGATVTSLLFSTVMQLLVYRMIDEPNAFPTGAATRGIQIGIIFSIFTTLFITGVSYNYLILSLGFTNQDVMFFSMLHFLYSGTWIIMAAFLANRHYYYPTLVFFIAYVCVAVLTYIVYQSTPQNIIVGYVSGIGVLFVLALIGAAKVFPWPNTPLIFREDVSKLFKFIPAIRWEIIFNFTYILAIFLDKIIVWYHDGHAVGQALLISGSYTLGAFLGLIPVFSIGTLAVFNDKTESIVRERFIGNLEGMKSRSNQYRTYYYSLLKTTLLISIALAIAVVAVTSVVVSDTKLLYVVILTSIGSIFLSGIVFNSIVLPVVGKSMYSTLALSLIITFEIASYPFLHTDIWYMSLGFMVGSCIGFIVSFISTIKGISNFEYNIFRMVSADTLAKLRKGAT